MEVNQSDSSFQTIWDYGEKSVQKTLQSLMMY